MRQNTVNNSQRVDDRLLRCHGLHVGLYARVAKNLDISPSYVSRVATGKRQNETIRQAILAELRRIERVKND